MTLTLEDQQRLDALKRFFVLDHTPPDNELERIVRFVGQLFGVTYTFLTLRQEVGEDKVAAGYGFNVDELPADAVLCRRTDGPSIPIVITDAANDSRFSANPLIRGEKPARMYAGVPLKSSRGFTLGTLAVMDATAQELNSVGMAMLADIGAMVEPVLQLIQARREQETSASRLEVALADLSEERGITALLATERDLAQEAIKAKSAFLASMSHEIRTALTSILGYAEFLADELADDQLEMAQTILGSSERLLQTLNSVMDMERLESEGDTLELEVVHLSELAGTTARVFERQAAARGLAFRSEGADTPLHVWADEGGLTRVIDNLVSNALKFTEKGGIRLRLGTDGEWVTIYVQDTGIGMDAEFLPHLFDRFSREGGDAERSSAGSGLGLALTKRLVELMGGQISVTSRKGEGSVFRVALRAASALVTGDPSGDGISTSTSAQPA